MMAKKSKKEEQKPEGNETELLEETKELEQDTKINNEIKPYLNCNGIRIDKKEPNKSIDLLAEIKNNDGSVRNLFVDKSGNIYYLEEAHSPEFYSEYEEDIPYVVHTITSEGSHSFFEIPVYNELRYSLFIKADTSGNILIGEEDEAFERVENLRTATMELADKLKGKPHPVITR